VIDRPAQSPDEALRQLERERDELRRRYDDAVRERASLVELAERRAARLQKLQEIGAVLARSLDEETILETLAQELEATLPLATVAVFCTTPEETAQPRVHRSHGREHGLGFVSDALRALAETAVAARRPVVEGVRVAVPIMIAESLLGVIATETREGAVLDPDDVELLRTVGAQVASAMSNAHVYAESHRQRQQMEALADVARAVGESLRLEEVLRLILGHATALLHTDGACISLVRGESLEVVAAIGTGDPLVGMWMPLVGSMTGRAVRTGMSIVGDATTDAEAYPPTVTAAFIRNVIIVPLSTASGSVGALTVFNRGAPFTPDAAAILRRFADQVAVAVVNARLFEDVTASRALAERHQRVVETSSDAIVITDLERRISFANPSAIALFGHGDALIGMPVARMVPEETLDHVRRREDDALAGEPQRYESLVVRADGERRMVAVTAAPLRDQGIVTGIVASLRDVTEERTKGAALARSEARYTRLVESASDAIFTLDRDGRFTAVNRSMERATGFERAALIGAPLSQVVDARDVAVAEQLLRQTFEGERGKGSVRYRAADGSVRQGAVITAPVFEDGAISGALGIMRDVTDDQRLAEQLLQQEKLAAVGQLVSGVAHELNNPLAGVMAFSELLLASDAVQDTEGRHALETIHHEAMRAAKIVSHLLTFARQRAAERTEADLNTIVTDTVALRRYALRAAQIELDVLLDPALPRTWADPFQLQQVVLNLLGNAEQALAEWDGARRITVWTRGDAERLVIGVSDTGPGVPPEQRDRIFNPFYTTKPVGQGTGLGLSISDGIVREHGGEIRVESQPGEGATFLVELPLADASDTAPAAEARRPVSQPARRMLVVDDEIAMRSAISRFLTSLGHTVTAAAGGVEARALLDANEYDVVLLDLRMPDLGGDTLYEELRDRDPRHARRVVFVTGDVQSDQARHFLDRAGRPVVGKPFSLDDLVTVLAGVTA
jgi:PAS domain S-box-containing protein